jgi:ATP-dependent RNA helicase SUPV3L1/SUV3
LARIGVRFGTESVYVEPLLRPDLVRFRALLWAVKHGRQVPPLPGAKKHGRAIPVDPALPGSFYAAIGRQVVGGLALRPDRLERLAAAARGRARGGNFAADAELAETAGLRVDELHCVLEGLGYRGRRDTPGADAGVVTFRARPRGRALPQPARSRQRGGEAHPFAKLKELKFA